MRYGKDEEESGKKESFIYLYSINDVDSKSGHRPTASYFESKFMVTKGSGEKLQNEDLSDLYSSPNIVRLIKSRRMRWAGKVVRMGEKRGVYRVFVDKPEEKRPLGRPRRRWEDNIKTDLQEVGCGATDWIELVQDRDR